LAAQDEVLSSKVPMAKFTLEVVALPVRRTEPTEPLLAAHEPASELPAAKRLLPVEEFGPVQMDKTRLYGAVLALQFKTATEIHAPPHEAELS
jgi:hypothetical protein